MPAEPAKASTMSEAERRAIYSRCERFLGGQHGPQRPKATLAALAEATDPMSRPTVTARAN